MEDSLKKAILKHGIPEQFYCDNGAAFSSLQLQRICGKLGIHLSHSKPYRPQGRGKIERWFQFVDTSFMPEAYQAIEQGKITSLMELNIAFTSWLDGFYHQRKHGTTNVTPMDRANSSTRETRRISVEELTDVFLWEDKRKVDKTGCIKMNGNTYEVDGVLCSKRICVRYDPFDLTVLQVFYQDKSYSELLQANGEIPPFSLARCRLQWAECLRLRQDEKCLVIVIDEAQDMSDMMIQELRFVVNQQMDACSDFPLILIGQPALRRITRLKKYDAVAQRIPLQYHLTGFTLEETAAYIRHQMKNEDLDAPLFTDRAIQLIYGSSQGIPRLINHICTQVLFAARQKNQEIIEDQDISRIISDSDRQRGDF